MAFSANQVHDELFPIFILVLIVICLAVVRVLNNLAPRISVSSLVLSSHVGCVLQQLNSRYGESHRHHVGSSLGSPVLFSVHSTTITNTLINQAGSYYAITNFYLIWDRSQLYPITQMISLLVHSPWLQLSLV